MNHQRDIFLLILFVLQGILFWQPGLLQAAENTAGHDVIFYYSNDVHGETEPCG
jgi:hypothetical protein